MPRREIGLAANCPSNTPVPSGPSPNHPEKSRVCKPSRRWPLQEGKGNTGKLANAAANDEKLYGLGVTGRGGFVMVPPRERTASELMEARPMTRGQWWIITSVLTAALAGGAVRAGEDSEKHAPACAVQSGGSSDCCSPVCPSGACGACLGAACGGCTGSSCVPLNCCAATTQQSSVPGAEAAKSPQCACHKDCPCGSKCSCEKNNRCKPRCDCPHKPSTSTPCPNGQRCDFNCKQCPCAAKCGKADKCCCGKACACS